MRGIERKFAASAVLGICVLASAVPAFAQKAVPKGKEVVTVTVTGAGESKSEAIRDALRKAVEKGAGTHIYSESKTSDFVLVKDTILARAAGFVQSYKEVTKAREMEDGTWEVKISAVVSVKGVVDAWGTTKALLKQVGRPRIVVFVREKIGGRVQEDSTVQARIENLLLKSGFILVDKTRIEALAKKDKALANIEDKPEKLIALLKKSRAQIVITGLANCAPGAAKVLGGVRLFSFEAEANIRTFRVDTGQMLSKIPGIPRRGTGRVARSAAKMALDYEAQHIAPLVQRDILRFWQDAVGGHGELELEVEGIPKFGQYVQVKKALAKIKGVEDVTGKYNKALTRFSIQAKIGAEALAEKIDDAVENVEIEDVSQNTIKAKYAVGE